jgi:predicted MPP superfamily phosphohydrolase
MNRLAISGVSIAGSGLAALAYGGLIERNAFTLRRFDVPVLAPGSAPLRVLHVSDLHITAGQARKQRWISALADLEPDLVVNTGDTISDPSAIPEILRTLEPLAAYPAVFVPGNNDYYAPTPGTPARYFSREEPVRFGPTMPWPELAAAMSEQGWTDLTHRRVTVSGGGFEVALAGTDDPHLGRADYDLIAGPADPFATVRIGVLHSPEPPLLSRFADDGYDLVLAGHTHGGQVRIPFGPAIVTNCGIDVHRARWLHRWDERMWFHVCAGLGTNPFMPIRFACRPEASLLTLVARAG